MIEHLPLIFLGVFALLFIGLLFTRDFKEFWAGDIETEVQL